MKYINTYNTTADYNNDSARLYPNVSYIKDVKEVKWARTDSTAIVTKFVTTRANENVTISTKVESFNSITLDGEPLTWKYGGYFYYTIADAGEHEVVYKTKNPSVIPNGSLNYLSNMVSVTIPSSVTTIENNAIKGGLRSITVDSGNTVYDSRDNCNAVIVTATNTLILGCNNTVIPSSVTAFGESAFTSCSHLTSATIPDGVTSIPSSCFYSCYDLSSVTIPDSVTSIGGSAFGYCNSLTSVTIPNTVTSIGGGAFSNSGLTSVVIPNTITTIENGTFSHSRSLASVTIPDTVRTIGENAFYETGLTSITIPNSVTSLGKNQFYQCYSLTSVALGSSVASIGESFFGRCGRLTSVTSLNTTPPTYTSQYGNQLFYGVPATCAIYVPAASVDAYKAANGWSERADYIQAIQ